MTPLVEAWEAVIAFFELGGNVLVVIFFVTLAMWILISERFLYWRFAYEQDKQRALAEWHRRLGKTSWHSAQIRRQLLAELAQKLRRTLPMIKTLVAVCPLLGLLGTVSGMIEVFDVLAIAGNGNPRAMASGVSLATIPTMAGMVAALSGLYFSARLSRIAAKECRRCEDAMLRS
ncbi:MAG: MotA/TolQ/ExbB proton channel family protein [Myxococcota bacterium]